MIVALLLAWTLGPAGAVEYGAKGIYPVYESGREWVIFDKAGLQRKIDPALEEGERFLLVGSRGSEVFEVERSSPTYGGACKNKKAVRLRASLLRGPRQAVGSPIIGIHVPRRFTLKNSQARFDGLKNEVS